jgi:hypothetical protein
MPTAYLAARCPVNSFGVVIIDDDLGFINRISAALKAAFVAIPYFLNNKLQPIRYPSKKRALRR